MGRETNIVRHLNFSPPRQKVKDRVTPRRWPGAGSVPILVLFADGYEKILTPRH
jgi:hypothetical protein